MTRRAARVTLAKNPGDFASAMFRSKTTDSTNDCAAEEDISDDEWTSRVAAVHALRKTLKIQAREIEEQIKGVEIALELIGERFDE